MRHRWSALIFMAALVGVVVASYQVFGVMHKDDPIVKGPGVTRVEMLSDYHAGLAGTAGDTEIYFMEGQEQGDTVLIMGAVHPNEPAGYVTSVLFIENVTIDAGRVIVIPRPNNSAFTHTEPSEAYPQKFRFELPDGSLRSFRFGSRYTNPVHQWPDSDVFEHYPSGQVLAGLEVRNLNRVYPGKEDGTLTQQMAYAITTLVQEEDVGMTIDLHEASPEYPVINTIVAHEDAIGLASAVRMELNSRGIEIGTEQSPQNLRGLSHRELGDYTDTLPMLTETSNPAMGRLRGRTDEALVLTGKCKAYLRAGERGLMTAVDYTEEGSPMETRVARNLATIEAAFEAYNFMGMGDPVVLGEMLDYREVEAKGVGAFLLPLNP